MQGFVKTITAITLVSAGYCHQDLKVIPTVRKLNIVDIVLQLSLWCVSVEIKTIARRVNPFQ
jgi:hypothetical protein